MITIHKSIFAIILSVLALIALLFLITIISSIFINPNKIYMKNSGYFRFLLYSVTALVLFFGRIRVHTEGLEILSENGIRGNDSKNEKQRFLIVSNHRSKFDPIVTWQVLRKYDLAFLSKEENMHIFSLGRVIRKCCFMSIDRKDPKNALKTLMLSADLIKAHEVSYMIYPEGTRSKTKEMLPFHNGIFKVAQMANVPIVVMSIQGAQDIKTNFPFKSSDVYVDILKVLPADEIACMRTCEIGTIAKETINNKLKERGL